MIFKNNAFSGCGQAFSFDGNVGNVIADNNAYANLASGNSIFNWSGHAGDGGSLANWQAGTGQDAASQANLTGALGMNGSGVPQAGSMVIGRGANLTSLGVPTLLNDKAGNPRPATGAWDVGAYNYGSVIGVLEKPRARNRNAQPLFMWPNPIKAALLYQYLHTQPNVSMYDVTGKVFTIGSITHNGIYVVKNGKNMVRQKLMVIK
jgi:hypothetical protein